jgi:hypothetical protein
MPETAEQIRIDRVLIVTRTLSLMAQAFVLIATGDHAKASNLLRKAANQLDEL